MGTLNFVNLVNFSLQKVQNFKKPKCRAFKCVKIADFETLNLPTLISRKIWVTEKLCNFHTVFLGCVMIQLLHFQLYIFNLGCSTFIFSTYHNFNFWIFNFSQNQPKCFQLWKFSTFCFFNFWQIQLFLFQLQPFSTNIISTSISVFD